MQMLNKLRFVRLRILVLITLLGAVLLWTVLTKSEYLNYSLSNSVPNHIQSEILEKPMCQHPDLEVFNPLMMKHVKDVGKLKCADTTDWLFLADGYVNVCPDAKKQFGPFSCSLQYFQRVDDFNSRVSKTVTIESTDGKQKLEADFFQANCKNSAGKSWSSILAGLHEKEEAIARSQKIVEERSNPGMGLNVLIVGLDSMSRVHYTRKLTKTYNYITKDLDGVVLDGYNIVGDGTPQALIPILTGFAEPELPETRKRIANANYVNIYPFAWKNFSEKGYVTLFAEDTPSTGIFTYRLTGFNAEPTDHYMRPFHLEAAKVLFKHKPLCLGSLPRHKVMLNWAKQFFQVYKNTPKFGFLFHGELSHDDYNIVQYADEDMLELLTYLKTNDYLNNTLLILMSDHGHRFASIRSTQQGKQEERLPFFSIIPPPSFKERYPELFKNLKINSKRLTTPFDIYPTLLTILNPNIPLLGDLRKRSISLFSEVPKERTCSQADIEPHWCTCLSWEKVLPTDLTAKQAAQAVIDYINEYNKKFSSLCAELTLDKVLKAEKHVPNPALLQYLHNKDQDGFEADLSDKMESSEIIYQVQFQVFPSQGLYEASVKYKKLSSTFHIRETEISRVNLYGNQPDCVQEKFPNLRKYCYCKAHLV